MAKVNVTVEVDLAAWRDEYGLENIAAAREDVRAHLQQVVYSNSSQALTWE